MKNLNKIVDTDTVKGFLVGLFIFLAISIFCGMFIGGVENRCKLDSRFGQINVGYRLGCYLTEKVEVKND